MSYQPITTKGSFFNNNNYQIKIIKNKNENCNFSNIRMAARSKHATFSDTFGQNATDSCAFAPYKNPTPSLRISLTHHTSILTNTNKSNIQLFHFFKMIPDLNYYPADEEKLYCRTTRRQ